MNKIDGGVLAAHGFKTATAAAGVKAAGGLDIGLLWSEKPATTAAIFTENSIVAAPVTLSRENIKHQVRAIIVNSGNANCMTGKQGMKDAHTMADMAAQVLKLQPQEILVASTGIIGKPLPIQKITDSVQKILDKSGTGQDFATAIMTTDTVPKETAYTCQLGGQTVTIGGCAKGSGMIQPNMATLLAFLISDVAMSPELLDKALREAARTSFNSITIDGCMSTNDTLALMANGQAANHPITEEDDDYQAFVKTLKQACLDLALMIVRDGEGATMLVTVQINGAESYDQAKAIGYAVANSPLVKTATGAKTDNWGRIAQAIGSLGLPITEDNLAMKVHKPAADELKITVNLSLGSADATIYTCDLTKDYIDINVAYN